MFEYEVVSVMLTRGAGGSEASGEWERVRAALNERGRLGYRVVAVTDGPEGRAIIMERRSDTQSVEEAVAVAEVAAISQEAEAITREAAEPDQTR